MANVYQGRLFEFTNVFREKEEWFDSIRLVQVGETYLDAGACIEEHVQSCHELSYILSGSGVFQSGDNACECRPGDMHIISKGVQHKITAKDGSKLRFIHFAFDFNENAPDKIAQFFENCHSLVTNDDSGIRTVLSLLVDEYYNNSEFSDIMKKSLVSMIVVLIWRKIHVKNKKHLPAITEEPIGSVVYNIMRYVEENVSQRMTVTKIAEKFSYSASYISHLFKTKTGVSLQEYIIVTRMEYAKKLLSEGKASLGEISSACGYSSIPSFCKVYKKYMGHTPSQSKTPKV